MVRLSYLLILFYFSQFKVDAQSLPVIAHDFPDPTVIYANGKYYAYATNSIYEGKSINIQVAISKDLKKWTILGDALPKKPAWGRKDFWAPHVLYDKRLKKYVLFYSAESNSEKGGKSLGVAFSENPEGPYVDKGTPLLSGVGFREIDPYATTDFSGKNYLVWGSDSQPIKIQEMKKDWTDFLEKSYPKELMNPGKEKNYTRLIEGAWIDYNNGYYFLFYSGDNCCGSHAKYAVLVARAKKITGPYITLGQYNKTGKSVILENNNAVVAPGHNSIIKDKKGVKWIAYHAIPKANFEKGIYERHFYLSKIIFINNWPKVVSN